MANKITQTFALAWSDGKDNLKVEGSTVATQTGINVLQDVQNIANTATAIVLADVVPAYIAFKNLDATATITVYSDSGSLHVVAVLLHGQGVAIQTTVTAFWAKGDQASGDVALMILALAE